MKQTSGIYVKEERGITHKFIAANYQAITKNYFKNKILKKQTDSKCRLCE
jgi:hypothetical protein